MEENAVERPPRESSLTVAEDVFGLVGGTPLVRVDVPEANPGVDVYAKLEGVNPSGSVKDRIARRMLERAEATGALTPEKTIVEPTSGNTGIAVAAAAAAKGYDARIVMSGNMSRERVCILKALGADVVITPPEAGEDGAMEEARRLAANDPDGYWMPDQFSNEENVRAHYETTGPEIFEATDGEVTHFVAGMGTAGTVVGVGRYLKERDPSITVSAVHPVRADEIQGLKNVYRTETPGNFDEEVPDEVVDVDVEDANEWARRLTRETGLFVGQSSGATMHRAARVAAEIDEGLVVPMFADMGFKYLTTDPYADEEIDAKVEECRDREVTVEL
ncbi:MAG: PLP-dependent cysteine synthase family protein [Haloferacaceae archaeon]